MSNIFFHVFFVDCTTSSILFDKIRKVLNLGIGLFLFLDMDSLISLFERLGMIFLKVRSLMSFSIFSTLSQWHETTFYRLSGAFPFNLEGSYFYFTILSNSAFSLYFYSSFLLKPYPKYLNPFTPLPSLIFSSWFSKLGGPFFKDMIGVLSSSSSSWSFSFFLAFLSLVAMITGVDLVDLLSVLDGIFAFVLGGSSSSSSSSLSSASSSSSPSST